MATGIAIAGLVVGVIGERKKEKQLAKAEDREERARETQKQIQDVQVRRQRVSARKQARAARAEAISSATAQGAGTSSAAAGAAGSAISQFRGNVGFLDTIAGLTSAQLTLQQSAANARGTAATFGSLSGVGFDVFSAAGGFEQIFAGGGPVTGRGPQFGGDIRASGSF